MSHLQPEDLPVFESPEAPAGSVEDKLESVARKMVFTGSVRGSLPELADDLAWLEANEEALVKRIGQLAGAVRRVQHAFEAEVAFDRFMGGQYPPEGVPGVLVELLRRDASSVGDGAGGGGGPLLEAFKQLQGRVGPDGRVRLPPSDPVPVTGGGERDDTGRINRVG